MPKISVMTCTCRDNPNIDKMAQCLMNQTFKDFEWIIVDRKIRQRPEEFYAFIQAIVHKAFTVRVIEPKWSIYHDFNMPAMSNARNSGIMEADGELLVWVDDNIWFKPDFLARHYNVYKCSQETGEKIYMVGLGWSFPDWNTVSDFAKKEPFDDSGKLCREGTWFKNNEGSGRDTSASNFDDPRAYNPYVWPDSRSPELVNIAGINYEVVTGAWCYGRNMSMPLEATLDINGNDEDYDGVPEPQDCDYGLRLNNYGYKTLLDRGCCVYEYKGEDNVLMHKILPFMWGHIGEVNGVKATRGEFRLWSIMRTPARVWANWFDLRIMRDKFRKDVFRINL